MAAARASAALAVRQHGVGRVTALLQRHLRELGADTR